MTYNHLTKLCIWLVADMIEQNEDIPDEVAELDFNNEDNPNEGKMI